MSLSLRKICSAIEMAWEDLTPVEAIAFQYISII